MASFTLENENPTSLVLNSREDSRFWDDSLTFWDDMRAGWDSQRTSFAFETKNGIGLTLETKN